MFGERSRTQEDERTGEEGKREAMLFVLVG